MIASYVLLAVSFVMLLAGAIVFTNAVEWAGQRLNLGHGAVGSVLAAVATALPESVIPVIAILAARDSTAPIAVGSILGAPFLLGTLGMLLVGVAAIGFRSRREQPEWLRLDMSTMTRDLRVFLVFLGVALLLGLLGVRAVNVVAAIVFVVSYGVYVWRTIASGNGSQQDEQLNGLHFDPAKKAQPRNALILLQVAVGLALIVGGGYLFVRQIEHIASTLGVSALVLALVLAPLASELPEKANSVLWVYRGKDDLALGNITGAMVFQSMLPVSVGLAFTNWQFHSAVAVVAGAALLGGGLALGAVHSFRRYPLPALGAWTSLYVGASAYVIVAI